MLLNSDQRVSGSLQTKLSRYSLNLDGGDFTGYGFQRLLMFPPFDLSKAGLQAIKHKSFTKHVTANDRCILIFSKHKKQGAEVGRAIKKTLLMSIQADITLKKNKLPAAAMNDRYIIGFVIYFSAMSIDMVFKGAFWKNKKRMEFLIECWQEVGISMDNIHDFLKVMGDPIKEGAWDTDGQYSQGKNAAALVLTSAYGVLNRDELQNEIIILAQKKAKKRIQIGSETGNDLFDNSALSAAICEITIQSHMKKYYSDL